MAGRKTKKELQIEIEIAREAKKTEFSKRFHEMQRLEGELGLEILESDETSYVANELNEWESHQVTMPTGKYQDFARVRDEYQKHFVIHLKECCPESIDELRQQTELFSRLFGTDREKYHFLFDRFKTEFLFALRLSLEQTINQQIKTPHIRFRPSGPDWESFRYDYCFGELEGTMIVLRLLFNFAKSKREKMRHYKATVEYVRNHLVHEQPYAQENKTLEEIPNTRQLTAEAKNAVLALMEKGEELAFLKSAKQQIEQFLNELSELHESEIEAFIELQIELIEWARKHSLEKDWLIRYAYFFISEFCGTTAKGLLEIEVPSAFVYPLKSFAFEFRFDGWNAAEETKHAFERRLKNQFKTELDAYFRQTAIYLHLDQRRRSTTPRDFDRVEWLVRWTVSKWTMDQILREATLQAGFNADKHLEPRTITKAFSEFAKFDLPYQVR